MKKSFMLQVKNAFSICVLTLTLLFALKSETAFAQPSFVNGATQSFTICQDSGPTDITSFLSINDLTAGSTETWSIISSTSGTLSGFSFSDVSTGFVVTPTGLSYTPPSGFSGTDVFTIQVSDGTISDVTTITVTVNPFPSVPAITGADTICNGFSGTLSNTVSGGTWATSDATIASVHGTLGSVNGISVGNVAISYSVTNSCGTTTVTHPLYIDDIPTVSPVAGPSTVCVGSTNTFTDATAGGLWSSSASGVATVDPATGDVVGVSAGSADITYTVTNLCGSTSQFISITVDDVPSVSSIGSGAGAVCVGATITYTDATSGGTWTTSNAAVASVDAASGDVVGVATGSATITYSVSNSCGTTDVTAGITVNDLPTVAGITGTTTICVAAVETLSNATSGGAWSSDATGIATVDPTTGNVTGVSAGTANITYSVTNSCGTTSVATGVTISPLPATPSSISGASGVCVGATITLTNSVSGGSWTSDATGIATVNPSTGDVTGVSTGTANISYTITNSCGSNSVNTSVTVNDIPVVPAIGGTTTVCAAATTTLTNATSGGTWSSDAAGIATIDPSSGVVTGVAAGTANITYSVTNSCGTTSANTVVTVNPLPEGGSLSSIGVACTGTSGSYFLGGADAGGTWSSSDPSAVTIDPSTGVFTALTVGSGSVIIKYLVTNSCGVDSAQRLLPLQASPDAGTISGTSPICVGGTTTYTSSGMAAGAAWSTSDAAIASVDFSSGVVSGVAAGTATISYLVNAGACGIDIATASITIVTAPDAGTVSGTSTVCAGATTTLASTISGGTWSSDATGVATVDPATGDVTGVSAGSATISYSVTNSCGTAVATQSMTINDVPSVPAIGGTTTVCVGATEILTNATAGGAWSTDAASVASIDATTGDMTGVSAGTANITYAVTNGCGTTSVTTGVTVSPAPATPASITGASTVCVGATTTFSNSVTGGAWSSDASGIATVDPSTGDVTGVSAGTANISYTISNSCGSNSVSTSITINDVPSVPAIGGTTTVCIGATETLTNTTAGGTWSTDAASVASIDATTGDMTGVSAGTANITYAVTNSCGTTSVTTAATVNTVPSVATISGASTVCLGATTTYTNATTGGAWSTDAALVASVDAATGDVTGVSAGTANITYTVSNTCGSASDVASITVSPAPDAGTVSGTSTICVGATTTLLSTISGGTWSSDATGIATVDPSTGDVTGVTAGSATISYSVTNSCGTAVATQSMTINDVPSVPAIGGTTTVCVGATEILTNATAGGTWSTDAASVASIDATTGDMTGVSAGTANITYAVTNGCGTTSVTTGVTVSPAPATPASITGAGTVCVGATTTFSNSVSGGTWSSDASGIATVDPTTGDVTGVSNGTANISYTISNSCGSNSVSSSITVDNVPAVPAIGGTTTVCIGATETLTNATAGGTWSTDAASVASVDAATGDMTGVSAGTANITYSVSNSCGTTDVTTGVTVSPAPATPASVTGAGTVCVGATTTFSNSVTGGTWSSDASGIATVDPSTGDVTGVSAGTANISYTISNSCGSNSVSSSITINDVPSVPAIGGTTTVCVGATETLTNATAGGTWSTDAASVASIDAATGDMTGVSTGTANITYSVSNSCGTTDVTTAATVNAIPSVATISGASTVCPGATTTYTNATAGGAWSTDAASVASVDATTGDVTGVSAGTANITYTVTNTCGSASDVASITVSPAPDAGTVSGTSTICVGATTTLSSTISGGTWTSDATAVATVDPSTGDVTGVTAGSATISYSATNSCGTAVATQAMTINDVPVVPAIGGTTTVCESATTTLTNTTTGGTWSTDVATTASIDATTGDVTGVAAGTANITYTVTNGCGTTDVTTGVTVSPAPATPSSITGAGTVCVGATITFTNSVTGGTWSSDASGIATVDPTTGDVTGVSNGTANISYTISNSCGSNSVSSSITVDNVPSVPAIGGTTTVCIGATETLTNATAGGIWSTDAASVASVDAATGDMTGVSAGTANITYAVTNGCGTTSVTTGVTVSPAPATPASVTGAGTVCVGATTTFSNSVTGGTWSSDAIGIATVDPSTGDVTGVSAGTANISYTISNSCGSNSVTSSITVDDVPSVPAIGGATTICVAATTTLTNATSGGTWTTDAAGVASIDGTTGDMTGVSTGTANITYAVTNGCGTTSVTTAATVNTVPSVATISGASTVCPGATTTYTNATTGGAWSTDAASVASVDAATGDVTGVTAGTANITYTVTNTCGSTSDVASITVNPAPDAGTVSGTSTICVGSATTLSSTISGGTWSSDAAGVATVDPSTGDVTGVTAGVATISYSATNSCGTAVATQAMTINDVPIVPAIGGTTTVCESATTTLTNTTTGGTWSTDAATTASIDATTGDVTGVAAGTANITYTVTNSCGSTSASTTMTVNPAPVAGTISGAASVCVGGSTTFTATIAGGIWSSDDLAIASIDASTGDVTAIAAGTANISYAISNSCGTAFTAQSISVDGAPSVAAITGLDSVCAGNTISLSSATTGGTWSITDNTIASIDGGGVVTGLSLGADTVKYTVVATCGTTVVSYPIYVDDFPSTPSISGTSPLCEGATTTFTGSIAGGAWSTTDASVVSIDAATGLAVGISGGSATIGYLVTNACGISGNATGITVIALPAVGAVTGASSICNGTSTTLTNTTSGGTWSSSDASIATVDPSTGVVTGVGAGSAVIHYAVTGTCGTVDSTLTISIDALPNAGTISGPSLVCLVSPVTLSESVTGGTWSSNDIAIASVDPATGDVTGVALGSTTISYTVVNGCGTDNALYGITVDDVPAVAAVSGATNVCVGSTTTFTNATGGGNWSTGDITVASVDAASGDVFGVSVGATNITYSLTNSCGTTDQSAPITVNLAPNAGTILGAPNVCAGNTVTLSNATSGGVWSSSDAFVAAVDPSTGDVTGVSAGSVTISYIVTNSCDADTATFAFTVNDVPSVAAIFGTSFMCVGTTASLTDATAGGTWSTDDASIASVDASTGDVTAVGVGSVTISYTVTNSCGPSFVTLPMFVDDLPTPTPITGSSTVCVGSNTPLNNVTTGGVWTSSTPSIASINAGSGIVRGVAVGSATITYAVTNGCGTTDNTTSMTVNTVPTAAPAISGPASVCVGSVVTETNATPGGVWSSTNIATATISSTGDITGLAPGTVTISYTLTNACGSTATTRSFTVNDVPTVAAIIGPASVCEASATTLTNATGGGTWSSSNTSIATINPSTGAISGIVGGSVTITYAVTNVCGTTNVTTPFTVTPLPVVGPITGTSTVCASGSFLVSNDTAGGVWSSTSPSVATVDASGVVTGLVAGTSTIVYTLTTVCGTASTTFDIDVTDVPVVASIMGATPVCLGFTSLYTNDTLGGTWSTSDASIASIDATGLVTGTGVGSATISYTVTNFCGPTTATFTVTIGPAPVTGTITGATSVCAGSTTTLTDAAGGGTWSSSDATIASVDLATGVVYGVAAGTVTISYGVTNSCGTDYAFYTFTVDDVPVVPGITGVTTVCELATTSLGDAVAGGLWSSSDLSIASVDIAGVVYGVATGTATITYLVGNICGTTSVTALITVDPLPAASSIAGPAFVCVGSTITLTNTTTGGTWSSSDATIASVDASTGVVTGVSEAGVIITYSVTNSCGTADSTYAITIGDVPIVASITGASTLCPGTTATLGDATTGGTWSSSDAAVASIDAASGLAYGVAVGAATISYSVTNICGVTNITTGMTVNAVPLVAAITGTPTVCVAATTALSNDSTGGVWTSSDLSVASVDAASGVVYGVAAGTVIITYDITTGCGSSSDTILVTVNGTPTVSAITGASSVCIGGGVTLSNATTGGTWSTSDASIASVDGSGNVTTSAAGTVTISYTVSNTCGPTSSLLSFTVNPLPTVAAITGTTSLCAGSSTTLSDATTGGAWSSSDVTVASVDAAGSVYGVAAGTADITYTVTSSFGCVAFVSTTVTVNALPALAAISGPTGVALSGTATLTNTTTGGTWSSSNSSVATINPSTGVVNGVAYGTATITYTYTNASGCTSYVTSTIGVAGSLSLSTIYPIGSATFCHNTPVPLFVYTADTSNHLTYQWYRNGVVISGATDSAYTADSIGYYSCSIANAAGSVMLTGTTVIAPPHPVIGITAGNILFTGSFATYQWMLNGVIISGATASTHTETAYGFYNVIVSDANGCTDTSASFVDTNWGVGVVLLPGATDVKIYPNPATSVINIDASVAVSVSILSMDGKVILHKENTKSVEVSELTGGMYMIMVYDEHNMLLKTDRFVKVE